MAWKRIVKKIICYTLLLFVLYLLQGTVFTYLKLFGSKPLIFPLAAIAFGIFDGHTPGALLGLVCGILCDFTMGDSTVLFTIALPAAGFFCALLSEFILAKGFPSFLLCSVLTLLIVSFLQAFKFYVFIDLPFRQVTKVLLLQIAASAVFIVPIYWTVRFVSRRCKI